ncbi:hypothetical protein M405DRAFT_20498 [Rhizopogon salebrosus TDB-379]|nr:hypothetical protein M405DRAFT_20498 [Rhizopogon salebrosus TDB-379]
MCPCMIYSPPEDSAMSDVSCMVSCMMDTAAPDLYTRTLCTNLCCSGSTFMHELTIILSSMNVVVHKSQWKLTLRNLFKTYGIMNDTYDNTRLLFHSCSTRARSCILQSFGNLRRGCAGNSLVNTIPFPTASIMESKAASTNTISTPSSRPPHALQPIMLSS